MNDPELVRHVLDHYIARDRFRAALHDYAARGARVRHAYDWIGNHPHVTTNGIRNKEKVHQTRMELMRLKRATLEHLHMLLHAEPMLDEDSHMHIDDDIFRFIIQEMP